MQVKKNRGRPRKATADKKPREGKPLNVWIASALMKQLELLCKRDRRSKTVEVEMILEKYLTDAELWPVE